MFRTAALPADSPCTGGLETMVKGRQAIYVEGMAEILRDEVVGHPYCSYEHLRTFAQKRMEELDRTLAEPGRPAAQLEEVRKRRRAWADIEKEAAKGVFQRTRTTR